MTPEMAMVGPVARTIVVLLANVWIGTRTRTCFVISARVLLCGDHGVAAGSADLASIFAPAMSTGTRTIKRAAFWFVTVRERRDRAERDQRGRQGEHNRK
jgi:hypothetical protein